MALREPLKITIGAETFTIRTCTTGQLVDLAAAVKPSESNEGVVQIQKILAAALRRDHSEKAANIDSLECNGVDELKTAVDAILRFTGFLPAETEPANVVKAPPAELTSSGVAMAAGELTKSPIAKAAADLAA